jgi:energy-coupling factor transporter transmembrane protein EcfT
MSNKQNSDSIIEIIFGLFFFLFFRISSWLCSIPMWMTLILHFVIGLPWAFFWATLAVWLLAGVIRYSLIIFARWGANEPYENKENKNPYSHKNED